MSDKVRLGGMALGNGVLVHGPHSWACAVRGRDGELRVASGEKGLRSAGIESPLLRGLARLGEMLAVFPAVHRELPEAELPFRQGRVIAAVAGCALAAKGIRSSRLGPVAKESAAALLALVPVTVSLRGTEIASYHGAEHISIGSYEHDEPRPREHERCGSHLLGPVLVATVAGNVLAGRLAATPRGKSVGPARGGAGRRRRVDRALRLGASEPDEPGRPRARLARPPAAAPLSDGRADAGAARGGGSGSRRRA